MPQKREAELPPDTGVVRIRQLLSLKNIHGIGPLVLGASMPAKLPPDWKCRELAWAYQCVGTETQNVDIFVHVFNEAIQEITLSPKSQPVPVAQECSLYSSLVEHLNSVHGEAIRSEWTCAGRPEQPSCAIWTDKRVSVGVWVASDVEHPSLAYLMAGIALNGIRPPLCATNQFE
jgi:hypothetical protein